MTQAPRNALPTCEIIFEAMRSSYLADPAPDFQTRTARLTLLETALLKYKDALISAMQEDFSHRSATECRTFDITASLEDIRYNRKNLKRWMKVRRVATPLPLLPARCEIRPQPRGVVGVISPWNFPILLSLTPMAAALAAGNRVMLKPSELTPRTSEVLREMIAESFDPTVVCVITGQADVAAVFSSLQFDHLLFTGSTSVGRIVAQAAAKNLTPVTLELGGKSPAIVMPSADLTQAARRITWGKTANAGQVCVAPDYVLVPRQNMTEFVEAAQQSILKFYPEGPASGDYTAIISDRHLARLTDMLDDAELKGAKVIRFDHGETPEGRKLAPCLVIDPPLEASVMQEEIFGPILPIIPYDTPEEALDFVAQRDSPLALYVFAQERSEQEIWLENSISGGVSVNDTVIHVGAITMPFGGVGASGYGAYHAKAGFDTFSHNKPILRQRKWNAMFIAEPPVSGFKKRVLEFVEKIG